MSQENRADTYYALPSDVTRHREQVRQAMYAALASGSEAELVEARLGRKMRRENTFAALWAQSALRALGWAAREFCHRI